MGIHLNDNDHDCLTNMRFADDGRNTDKRRKHEILGPDDHFPATGEVRNQKSNQGCLGDVSRVQTGADIEKPPAQISALAVRRSDISDEHGHPQKSTKE